MQSSATQPEAPSLYSDESQPAVAATNAGGLSGTAGAVRQASHYIPSGFPRPGSYGAQALSGAGSSNSVAVHAEAGDAAAQMAAAAHSSSGGAPPPLLHYTDPAAAAEWCALYGASPAMMSATAGAFRAGTAGVSFMTPIFHLTAHDATILSMEHNNHCKLLGIATSRNEILVTWTQLMPVIENMATLRIAEDDLFGGEQAPPVDERLLEWDPATMSILIDELPYTCTELSWAPWQQGIYLAGLCPGHGIRIYRYSHGHWALDDCIRTTESTSCSISKYFTVACACTRGRVELWSRGATGTGGLASSSSVVGHTSVSGGAGAGGGSGAAGGSSGGPGGIGASGSEWMLCRAMTFPVADNDEAGGGPPRWHGGARNNTSGGPGSVSIGPTAERHRPRDILGVGWDESGSLLAVGDQDGAVHVVSVTQEGTRLGEVVFHLPPSDNAGACRQVAWAPSSGRSFLSLAMVFTNCVRLVLFRRPRFMGAAGLPHPSHGSRTGGAGHNLSSANHNGAGSGASPGTTLQVLASALVSCEEVAKLSWNGTGTRFTTSHLDSSVNIWAVDVRYQYQTTRKEGDHTEGRSANENGPVTNSSAGAHGRNASPEKRLSLVVSVRRTSSVHPYHAVSK